MKQLLYLLLSGFFFSSCYKEINLSEYRTTPKMVINSSVSPDTVVMASVTRTWFYPETTPYVKLPHAKVELYINDQYIEQMQWKIVYNPKNSKQSDTLFISNTVPAEGDKIKVIASTPEYGTATAEDIIPQRVPIRGVKYNIRKGDGIYQESYPDYYEIYYEVAFDELPEKNNYYLARVTKPRRYGYENLFLEVTIMEYIDPIFKEQNGILDSGLGFIGLNKDNGALFTDRNINGQTYTLHLKEIALEWESVNRRTISIYSLSESYYLYLLSLQKVGGSTLEGGLGNIGFAEPLRVYSNVEGGTGILGGNQHSDITITLNNIPKNN